MRKMGKSLRQLLCLGLALCMVLSILPVAAFAAGEGVAIDESNFPDENFRAYLAKNYDSDKNGSLSDEEIAKVTEIDVSYQSIYDVKGIEHFTALEGLNCGWNHLTQLDVSKNSALRSLSCRWNDLAQLDVSQNTELTSLICNNNYLANLDLSKNTKLEVLWCGGNPLTQLDVSKNKALTDLYCFLNKLTQLDVSQNTALTHLNCETNQLTNLDVSKNTKLEVLDCRDNAYTVCQRENLDLTKLPGKFDVTKVSNVVGGTFDVKNNAFSFNTGSTEATYDYAIGNGETANFKLIYEGEISFADISSESYYYEPVMWAVDKGITQGVRKDKFAPENSCTRAQMVTFLWRAAGCPKPQNTENSFTDVKKDYSYDAVLWAVEAGITKGVSADRFAPNSTCNREQMVMFLWRFQKCPEPQSMKNPFNDVTESSTYYKAILWAVENKITSGVGGGRFSPKGRCTRGQMVTFLYRTFQ